MWKTRSDRRPAVSLPVVSLSNPSDPPEAAIRQLPEESVREQAAESPAMEMESETVRALARVKEMGSPAYLRRQRRT